jgi:hypothetical protein
MLYKHLIEGAVYVMLPIYILWIINLVLIGILVYRWLLSKAKSTKVLAEWILFLGSFTFLWGVLWQVLGLLGALSAIEAAGDISPGLIAAGFKISLYSSTYGFALLLISSVFWFINRQLNKK